MAKEEKNIHIEDESVNETSAASQNETTSPINDDNGATDENPSENSQDSLEAAQAEISQLKDKYLRAVAEFDNYRKRTLKEKTELILNGGEKVITNILPIVDDIERALSDKTEDAKAIREGFELIYKKFIKTLESMGVKKIEAKDQDFNTDLMEAIAMVPGRGDEMKGKVIDCVLDGYMLNDKVIRHSKVAVGQ